LIDFLYLIFFERSADQAAIDHWSEHLARGLSPFALFKVLWGSAEFADKSRQNPYLLAPRSAAAVTETQSSIVTPAFFADLIALLEKDRERILEIGLARAAIAQWRYRDLMQAGGIKTASSAELAIPDTIAYNEMTLRSYVADDRPMRMIWPLVSIARVLEDVGNLKVLSIGARTEMELFALLGTGFSLPNITMIDLFSYSPIIQIGDMHKMEFPDDTFDVIVLGYVLGYSRKPS